MKKPGCSKCEETTVQGRAYIDEKTGLLCVSLEEKYEKPQGLKVQYPLFVLLVELPNGKQLILKKTKNRAPTLFFSFY